MWKMLSNRRFVLKLIILYCWCCMYTIWIKIVGEVWFDSEEFCDLVEHLQIPVEEVIHKYIDKVISGWIKVKDSVSINKKSGTTLNQCIFLSQDGRQCTIYEVRPQQCRTYPYWPRYIQPSCFQDNIIY